MYVIIRLHKRKGRCGARVDLLRLRSLNSLEYLMIHLQAKLPSRCLPLLLERWLHKEQETANALEGKCPRLILFKLVQIKINDLMVRLSGE